jgi:hypothetical protein
MTRLIDIEPRRRIGTSRRALTGRIALGNSQSAEFESSLERDWLEQLDFLPDVSALQVQPFTLEYAVDGRVRRYTPDIAAVWGHDAQATTVVYEVKPAADLRADWERLRPRFVAATRYCRARGWRFKIVNERHIRTPKLENVKFLRRFLRLEPDSGVRQHLLTTLRTVGPTTIKGLMAAAYWSAENHAVALPYLWKAVADFEVRISLDAPLTMATAIAPLD